MRKLSAVISILIGLFLPLTVVASDRNIVINSINAEYYSESIEDTIQDIQSIDVNLSDEEYFRKIFSCLDDYSIYYSRDEYINNVTTNNNSIEAEISNECIEIRINRFSYGIEKYFSEYLIKAKDRRIRKMELDLTSCPGGYISVMNAIANEIMPKGKVMTAKFKNREQVYYSELEKCPFDEIVVKVSSQTASAAEILAAGLQEAGVAKVVGVNTYGKTSIQSFHRLESGAAFKLTCGEYLTRNGNDISETGVIPDVVDYSYPVKIRWNDYCKEVFRNNKAVSE